MRRIVTDSDFREGFVEMLPATLALVPFGLVCGVGAAAAGASLIGAMGLSAIVFSGAAQILAVQLLAAGAPVDSNRKQQSPLFAAVRSGRSGMVEHLIRKGLSPNAKGSSGDTPIISAAAKGDAALVNVLVGGGATIDEQR